MLVPFCRLNLRSQGLSVVDKLYTMGVYVYTLCILCVYSVYTMCILCLYNVYTVCILCVYSLTLKLCTPVNMDYLESCTPANVGLLLLINLQFGDQDD